MALDTHSRIQAFALAATVSHLSLTRIGKADPRVGLILSRIVNPQDEWRTVIDLALPKGKRWNPTGKHAPVLTTMDVVTAARALAGPAFKGMIGRGKLVVLLADVVRDGDGYTLIAQPTPNAELQMLLASWEAA